MSFRLCLFVVGLPLACMSAAAARAGTVVLDPLTTPFVAPPCMTETGHWVMFTDRYCSGTCPPDSVLTSDACFTGIVANFGLELAITPGQSLFRMFQLLGDLPPGDDTSVEMLLDRHAFDVRDQAPGSWHLLLEWDSATWALDLAGRGATALRVPLSGDIGPARPVYVTAAFWNGAKAAEVTVPATSPGDLVVPFAAIGLSIPVASGIDRIVLVFSDCPYWQEFPCAAEFAPRRYRIGAPSFDTDVITAVPRRTWGALKAAYH
jgi:hypothetical protein